MWIPRVGQQMGELNSWIVSKKCQTQGMEMDRRHLDPLDITSLRMWRPTSSGWSMDNPESPRYKGLSIEAPNRGSWVFGYPEKASALVDSIGEELGEEGLHKR